MTVDSASRLPWARLTIQGSLLSRRSFLEGAVAAAVPSRATETENVYGECPSSLERPIQREEREREGEKRLAYARRPTTTGVPPAEINRGLIIIILFSPGLERPV